MKENIYQYKCSIIRYREYILTNLNSVNELGREGEDVISIELHRVRESKEIKEVIQLETKSRAIIYEQNFLRNC